MAGTPPSITEAMTSKRQTFELETIAAISTPPGRGGIGIVRLAGPDALRIAGRLIRPSQPLEHARARFTHILDPHRIDSQWPDSRQCDSQPAGQQPVIPTATLDEAVVTAFLAPHSYTGDDVVEIAVHGAPVILETILSAALGHGARLAAPGEFTQRAFLAGRLDLTQAEAVGDLIASQTLEQARAAAQQLGGALSRRITPAKERLLQLIALLEAGMDFASGELDDVDIVHPAQISDAVGSVQNSLTDLANSFRAGALLRSGVSLALVGRPNAGKSSLFNRLLERPRAIVTPVPGTTRDTVEESWSVSGIPVRLVDTAGLRLMDDAPADEAERQGIERSLEALADADLVLLVHDATQPVTPEEHTLAATLADRPHLLLRNKTDLLSRADATSTGDELLPVSALTGDGIEELRRAILLQLTGSGGIAAAGSLNNLRQRETILAALSSLTAAMESNHARLPHEIILLDLHNALRAVDSLTGQTTADDILARIFSTFCIGK